MSTKDDLTISDLIELRSLLPSDDAVLSVITQIHKHVKSSWVRVLLESEMFIRLVEKKKRDENRK